MKKAVLFYSVFLLSFLIAIPQAFADAPKIFFAKKISYTYMPDDAVARITVDAIDINGEGLFPPTTPNITSVSLGGTTLQILGSGPLAGRGQQLIVSYPANVLSGSHLLRVTNLPAKTQTAYFELAVGAIGPQGDKGEKGLQGTTGTNGTNGTDGTKGAKGDRGLQGTVGSDGTNGTNGTNGTKGNKGDKGDRGLRGTAGTNGINGTKGVKGDKGNTSTKAWINFNGRTRNPSIRSNSGIASVTRVSTGEYRINFTTPFATTGYVMTGSASGGVVSVKTVTTSSITINLKTSAGRAINGEYIMLEFTGS